MADCRSSTTCGGGKAEPSRHDALSQYQSSPSQCNSPSGERRQPRAMTSPANNQHKLPNRGRQSAGGALRHHQKVTPAAINQAASNMKARKRERPRG